MFWNKMEAMEFLVDRVGLSCAQEGEIFGIEERDTSCNA